MPTLRFGSVLRTARANQTETTINTSPLLRLFATGGSPPANPAAADPAGLVVEITLPADWLTAGATGVKTINGSWADVAIDDGTIDWFRIRDSGDVACHIEGDVTVTGGGGAMTVNRVAVLTDDEVSVTTFTLTEGNA